MVQVPFFGIAILDNSPKKLAALFWLLIYLGNSLHSLHSLDIFFLKKSLLALCPKQPSMKIWPIGTRRFSCSRARRFRCVGNCRRALFSRLFRRMALFSRLGRSANWFGRPFTRRLSRRSAHDGGARVGRKADFGIASWHSERVTDCF